MTERRVFNKENGHPGNRGKWEKLVSAALIAGAGCVGEGCATTAAPRAETATPSPAGDTDMIRAPRNPEDIADNEQCAFDIKRAGDDVTNLRVISHFCPEAVVPLLARKEITLEQAMREAADLQGSRRVQAFQEIGDILLTQKRIEEAETFDKNFRYVPGSGDAYRDFRRRLDQAKQHNPD